MLDFHNILLPSIKIQEHLVWTEALIFSTQPWVPSENQGKDKWKIPTLEGVGEKVEKTIFLANSADLK